MVWNDIMLSKLCQNYQQIILLSSNGQGTGCQFPQILCGILVLVLSLHTLSFSSCFGVKDCTRTTEQRRTDLWLCELGL